MDKFHDECGIVALAIPGNKEVARIAYFGLNGIQHRGQESTGMAVSNDGMISCFKDDGLIIEVFDEKILSLLKGEQCLGHVNYGKDSLHFANTAQPFVVNYSKGSIAVAFNGGLINARELRAEMEGRGQIFTSTSDCELIAYLIAQNDSGNIVEAIRTVMGKIKGGYALSVLTTNAIIGVRDAHAIRPLCFGTVDGGYVPTSENCAIDLMGGEMIRDLEPGEILVIQDNETMSYPIEKLAKRANCIFEYVYFAWPDSTIDGMNVYLARENAGKILAKESPVEADLVVGVPDSGTPAATGFAAGSGIPYSAALIKNKYIGRTFIESTQEKRDTNVRIKLNPVREVIAHKRIVLVDDSIVRGTTVRNLIAILKSLGAVEVHLRISSPPVHHSCYFGVDTPDLNDLIANTFTKEQICEMLGADSLEYLSIEGLAASAGGGEYCLGCFNGIYPEF